MHTDPESGINRFAFAIVHWSLTLIVAPGIILAYQAVATSYKMNETVGIYFLFVLYGMVFSLPTLALYLLAYNYLVKSGWPNVVIKAGLNTVAVLGIVITFQILGGSISTLASVCYASAVVFVSLFFKINNKSQTT